MLKPLTQDYDLVVIGSGPGGYKAAVAATHLGAKVAIIEKSLPGGTCLNQGCVPKETLMRVAKLIDEVESLNGHGIQASITGDFQKAIDHKDEVVKNIRSGLSPWLRQLGIRLIEGSASFINEKTIEITQAHKEEKLTFIKANKFIIATGAKPKHLDSCPTDGINILNSSDFMFKLDKCPNSVLCVGGGAIGTEFGYLLHRFGAQVTIVEKESRLLKKPSINARASNTLNRKFKKLGIQVKNNCTVLKSEITDDGVLVTFSDNSTATYEKVLVAIGRSPNTHELNLESANVHINGAGFVKTNEFLETTCKGIYAVGDVKCGPMTANAAFHDAKVAAHNAICGNDRVINYNRVPIVIDSALPIASVGLTEERAENAGFEPEVARINLAGSTKARITHDSEGYIEVVHDDETGQLLGGSTIGPQAGEMIHMLTAACQSDRGLWFFTDISYAHPSWNEELENAIHSCIAEFAESEVDIFQPGIYANL